MHTKIQISAVDRPAVLSIPPLNLPVTIPTRMQSVALTVYALEAHLQKAATTKPSEPERVAET